MQDGIPLGFNNPVGFTDLETYRVIKPSRFFLNF